MWSGPVNITEQSITDWCCVLTCETRISCSSWAISCASFVGLRIASMPTNVLMEILRHWLDRSSRRQDDCSRDFNLHINARLKLCTHTVQTSHYGIQQVTSMFGWVFWLSLKQGDMPKSEVEFFVWSQPHLAQTGLSSGWDQNLIWTLSLSLIPGRGEGGRVTAPIDSRKDHMRRGSVELM